MTKIGPVAQGCSTGPWYVYQSLIQRRKFDRAGDMLSEGQSKKESQATSWKNAKTVQGSVLWCGQCKLTWCVALRERRSAPASGVDLVQLERAMDDGTWA